MLFFLADHPLHSSCSAARCFRIANNKVGTAYPELLEELED
jgi:hypothetical protein